MLSMERTLNDLVEDVSKSKKQATDIYYRTISRQMVFDVYQNLGTKTTANTHESDADSDPKTKKLPCSFMKKSLLSDSFSLDQGSKHNKCDKDMRYRLDNTLQKITEHMCQISDHCQCFYKSCSKKSLSEAETRHFKAYHKTLKSPKKKSKKHTTKESSSECNTDDSVSGTSGCKSSTVPNKEHKPYKKQVTVKVRPAKCSHKAKDSFKKYDKNCSHSIATAFAGPEQSQMPYQDKLYTTLGNSETFTKPVTVIASTTKGFLSSSLDDSTCSEGMEEQNERPQTAWAETLYKNPQTAWAETLYKNPGQNPLSDVIGTAQGNRVIKLSQKQNAGVIADTARLRTQSLPLKPSYSKAPPTKRSTSSAFESSAHVQGRSLHSTADSQKRSDAMNAEMSRQGICIITNPGQYIVRKPLLGSNKHLFHVEPGQFIKLNINDLDNS
uniref:Uncharacterized protein n=1 Tax=Biomphalaria glabrata TaxID=6526 RepID=A0A2C9L2M0_BIOGL